MADSQKQLSLFFFQDIDRILNLWRGEIGKRKAMEENRHQLQLSYEL